jgi:uncharacterized cupin superfamily protein
MASKTPSIIDLNAELAKLTMCRQTPQSTMADRKGSVARLASYRDGALLAIKFSGKDHWESHPGDELIHILDGTAILEIVCDDGPPKSFVLRAGMMAVIPQGGRGTAFTLRRARRKWPRRPFLASISSSTSTTRGQSSARL